MGYVPDVLIAYATKNGSTQQVAEAVTAAMRSAGAQVTALPAREVRESVAGYDLVVLGAPLYSGRWHHDAHRFAQLDRALAKRAWLAPVMVTIFGGVDPPGRGKGPQRDLRNWQTIHTWATDTLATAVRTGHTATGQ